MSDIPQRQFYIFKINVAARNNKQTKKQASGKKHIAAAATTCSANCKWYLKGKRKQQIVTINMLTTYQ